MGGMADELTADFEKRYPGGAVVTAALRRPLEGASVTVLFGPSGSGKTTILRCLAGLERPERGVIRYGPETWLDAAGGTFVAPQRRHVGYLFQDYALFPHLTVRGNIAYGLRGVASNERQARVQDLIALLGLDGLEDRYPRKLSGGEQQRVALARALAVRPRLLLLDEPLSALDTPTRERLRRELRRLLRRVGTPALVVTHDRAEALALGDQLVVVDAGRVRQVGPAPEVFGRPADLEVARILGVETVVAGDVCAISEGLATVAVGSAQVTALARESTHKDVYVCIRAEDVLLERGAGTRSSARNRLPGRVRELGREGPMVRVTLDCGFPLIAVVTPQACDELDLREGTAVTAVVKAPAIHLVDRE